jgi:hypothetical protein
VRIALRFCEVGKEKAWTCGLSVTTVGKGRQALNRYFNTQAAIVKTEEQNRGKIRNAKAHLMVDVVLELQDSLQESLDTRLRRFRVYDFVG